MELLTEFPPNSCGWFELPAGDGQIVEGYLSRAAIPGPIVVATAGIHGDEYEGPAALIDLSRTLSTEHQHGTVILFPVANPMAFQHGTRLTPADGKNLARTFPGKLAGTPTEHLAAVLFQIVGEADYLIDLHSGGVEYDFLPVAGFYGSANHSNPSFQAASTFGLKALWQLPPTPGVLSYELHRRGKVVCGCEYRGAGQLSRLGRIEYCEGLRNSLSAWGFCGDRRSVPSQHQAFTGEWILAEADGAFEANCALGQSVAAGDVLATISNRRGIIQQTLIAHESGMILGLRHKVSIRTGNWAVLLGIPLPDEQSANGGK